MESSRAPALLDWHSRQRWMVLGLAVVGVVLFAASYFLPWWNFDLVSPQYPKGLKLVISLSGVTGDVSEINIINHYIGMSHLDEAATLERAWGGYLVGGLCVAAIATILFVGRRLNALPALVALGFPIGFIADTMYWLYSFGHVLDPKAPVHIAPFTPTLFGAGKVGQFLTTAWPALGFWLATGGVVLMAVASFQRKKVCDSCPAREACEAACGHGLVKVP